MRDIALKAGQDRGVDYSGGRCAHLWAKEAGFELVRRPITRTTSMAHTKDFGIGRCAMLSKGSWKREAYRVARLTDLVVGMTEADDSPETVVAHCRMHQLIAKKPAN
jgi:hypothetical protein